MNVFLWIAIACTAVVIICVLLAIAFDTDTGSVADDTLGIICIVAFIAAIACFIIGFISDNHETIDQQKKNLQKIGFSYVNVDYADEAVVSMPTYAKGCRLKLEKDGKFWLLRLPKDQTRSITTAKEVASWPSVVEWCKQPQPK